MDQPVNEFLVKDLYLAAILVTKGLKFTDVRPFGKAFLFVFDDDLAKPYVQDFWNGTLEGNYKQLVNTIHDLKAQMRSMSTASGEF